MKDAAELLGQMRESYASLRSYSDTGKVSIAYVRSGSERPELSMPFATWFQRPDRFRFEFRDLGGTPRVITWNGEFATWNGDEVSLGEAVARGTGCSHLAAHRISCLLLPKGIPRLSLGIESPIYEREELIGKVPCHRIMATGGGREMILWLDSEDCLIRRVFERFHHGPPKVKVTLLVQRRTQFARARAAGLSEKELLLHLGPEDLLQGRGQESYDSETLTTYEMQKNRPIDPALFEK